MAQKEKGQKSRKNLGTLPHDPLDEIVNDSFPASDPPSHTGITGIVGRHPSDRPDQKSGRPPSHQRGHDARPTGYPTWERHAAETAHCWEDEEIS